jgi:IS1 family transposase
MSNYRIAPKQTHYDTLEVDELWTFVGRKSRRVWLVVYAYCRESGEIVAFVWGKRNLKTARQLRLRVAEAGVTCEYFATDLRRSFPAAFKEDSQKVGKAYTSGIEGNNCRLRQGTEGVRENLLLFKEKSLPPEGFQSGILVYQLWPCKTYHTFCITTQYGSLSDQYGNLSDRTKSLGLSHGGGNPTCVLVCGSCKITNHECSIFIREYAVSERENRGAELTARVLGQALRIFNYPADN